MYYCLIEWFSKASEKNWSFFIINLFFFFIHAPTTKTASITTTAIAAKIVIVVLGHSSLVFLLRRSFIFLLFFGLVGLVVPPENFTNRSRLVQVETLTFVDILIHWLALEKSMTHIFFGSIKNGGNLFNYRKVANNSTSFKTMQCVRNDVKLEKNHLSFGFVLFPWIVFNAPVCAEKETICVNQSDRFTLPVAIE